MRMITFTTLYAATTFAGMAQVQAAPQYKPASLDFISIGAGIDNEASDTALHIIGEAIKNRQVTTFTLTPWGREGEFKVCVDGPGKPWGKFELILNQLEALATSSDLVHFSHETSCELN